MKLRRLLFFVLLCAPVGLSIWLWRVPDFVLIPRPAENYQKAIEKFGAIEKAESQSKWSLVTRLLGRTPIT